MDNDQILALIKDALAEVAPNRKADFANLSYDQKIEALGLDFHTRGRRLDETLAAVRGAFDSEYVSHHGEFYSYSDMGVAPTPVGSLPIWVGGMGDAAWRRVGRIGDGYVPMGNPLE